MTGPKAGHDAGIGARPRGQVIRIEGDVVVIVDVGLELILAPFSIGLNLSASAFAYRVLVQDTAVVRAG